MIGSEQAPENGWGVELDLRTAEKVSPYGSHLGYVERDTYEKYYGAAIDSIVAYAEGKPINILNSEVLNKP